MRGIGEGVVVTDPDGQVRLMNPIAERFLDIDEQFAFGRNLFAEQRDSDFARTWRTFVDGREDLGGGELKIGAGPNRVFVVTLSRMTELNQRVDERFAVRDGLVQIVDNRVSVLAVQALSKNDVKSAPPADAATADERRWNDAQRQVMSND